MRAERPSEVENASHSWWSTSRTMLAALAVVVASFLAASAYAEHRAAAVDGAATSIAENAAPSVEHLASARAETRRLQALTTDYVTDAVLGRPSDRSPLDAARRALSRAIEAYLVLPVFAGERDIWTRVSAELAELNQVEDRVLSLVAAGHADEARELAETRLRTAFDRTADATLGSLDFNAHKARRLASTIGDERLRLRSLGFELDALSVLFAAAAGWFAVTHLRRQEAKIHAHERILVHRASELEQFAGRVAHDVLGPLGTVLLSFDMATRRRGDEKTLQTLARGQRSAERIRRIVDGLYTFARAGARPEAGARADLAPVVEDLASELGRVAAEADAVLHVEPFPRCAVATNPGVLTSVLANLVRNALKYLDDAPVRRVVVRVLDARACVRVEVEDTGPGIPPDLEGTLFEPYVRAPGAQEPGMGLGLATVKRLVEAHGGHVGCRSMPGRGALFWFELPKAGEEARPDDRRSTTPAGLADRA